MIPRLDRITTLAILVISVLYTVEALRFPGNAKIVPAIFGGLAILIALMQLLGPRIAAFRALSGTLKIDDERDLAIFGDAAARRRLLFIGASLLAIPLLIFIFGLPLALPLYVAGLLLLLRQQLRVVVACTLLIVAMSYGLLVQLLAWPWNDGLVWSLLR